MGIKKLKGKDVFVFETEEERKTLEAARNYFGESSTLLIDGLGYKITKKSSPSTFNGIKRGGGPGYVRAISIESWKKIQEYASKQEDKNGYPTDHR